MAKINWTKPGNLRCKTQDVVERILRWIDAEAYRGQYGKGYWRKVLEDLQDGPIYTRAFIEALMYVEEDLDAYDDDESEQLRKDIVTVGSEIEQVLWNRWHGIRGGKT